MRRPLEDVLTAAERRAVEQCEGGVYLACYEQGNAYLWPRCVYPGLDDALIADHELAEGRYGDPDLEADPFRARLVWAWETERGYWQWDDIRNWMSAGFPETVECWEITWL